MPKKVAKVEKKEDDGKLFAFLAVLLSILGFIIALLAKKDNKYVMFYAKQSLVLFIAFIIDNGMQCPMFAIKLFSNIKDADERLILVTLVGSLIENNTDAVAKFGRFKFPSPFPTIVPEHRLYCWPPKFNTTLTPISKLDGI